jgi:hypothetical protein
MRKTPRRNFFTSEINSARIIQSAPGIHEALPNPCPFSKELKGRGDVTREDNRHAVAGTLHP